MSYRSTSERITQSLAYEAGGFLIATPLYAALFGASAAQSATLMVALSIALLVWVPMHNAVFDTLEWIRVKRVASDRPHMVRLGHAISLEASSTVVSVPIIMVLGGHGFWQALAVDIGLTLLYAIYAYGFFLAWDRVAPIPTGGRI